MKYEIKELGKHIKEQRMRKHINQSDLAEAINVSTPYISRIETGTRLPTLDTVLVIAEVLDTTMEELLTGRHIGEDADKSGYIKDINTLMKKSTNEEQAAILHIASAAMEALRKIESHNA